VWIKIIINYCKSIFVGAYYRPHTSYHVSIEQLETSLSQLTSSAPNSIVYLAGDFNAPNIDWSNLRVLLGSPYINCQQYLLDIIEDHCMTQFVTEFTRGDHILDLFLTNCPSLISDTTTSPRLSDHNMILTKLSAKPPTSNQTKRSILLYNKANWNAIRTGLQPLVDEFCNYNSRTSQISVDDM